MISKFTSLKKKSKYRFHGIILLLLFFTGGTCIAQVPADSTATYSVLLKQIEAQMQQESTQPAVQQTRSGVTANPDIGVIGDFQTSYISRGKKKINAYLNETEVSLQ